jgi:putative ABC transport system ATP-binding protein
VIGLMKKMRDELGTTFVFSTHDPKIMSEARCYRPRVRGW